MRHKTLKAFSIVLLALMVVGLSTMFLGTTTTRTSTAGDVGGFAWLKWNQVTLAAATDTAIFTFPSPPDYPQRSSLYDTCFQVTVSTQSGNGDSVDVSVRFESSFDNTNWEIFTVGTDSTTWVSTTTNANGLYTPHTKFIGFADNGGRKPYNRFRIFGNTGNQTGGSSVYTRVKVDVVGFD